MMVIDTHTWKTKVFGRNRQVLQEGHEGAKVKKKKHLQLHLGKGSSEMPPLKKQ